MTSPSSPDSFSSDPFPTTQWTLVQIAQGGTAEEMRVAMEEICRRYWRPIFSFLIHSGHSKPDAEDLTQVFFQKIISEEAILAARSERGRLRSFMLGMLRRVISRHARHDGAQKRGGGRQAISLDALLEDEFHAPELIDGADPETLYNRLWARQVMEHARQQLRFAFEQKSRVEVFDAVSPFLAFDTEPPSFGELAIALKSSESAVRQLLHRLRKKYRDLLDQEVARTVMRPEDVREELEWLRHTMSRG
ncbi:sigma-70 family RNA polymerase sigma factor [Phragmitibacter flavus]|uniref:Sigma-70 family RNA polymerase sigma factor n=1 Tax=Phragmitibacter flavus TaxID=2576071 RepID=A0A5R8KJV1_9BACT|nr:ECF-type sigma factor [Phragmitibacter flavus]TLD72594.1 sigma-70 family RNA polymerase sigma factor [Phragmitibacter flavus]